MPFSLARNPSHAPHCHRRDNNRTVDGEVLFKWETGCLWKLTAQSWWIVGDIMQLPLMLVIGSCKQWRAEIQVSHPKSPWSFIYSPPKLRHMTSYILATRLDFFKPVCSTMAKKFCSKDGRSGASFCMSTLRSTL